MGIKGVAAPSHAAEVSGHHQSSLEVGRSEDAFIAQMRNVIAAPVAVFRGWSPSLIGRKSLWSEWWRRQREGLRGRSDFTRNLALGDGPLLNRKNGLAGVAVQNVEKPGFVALNDDGDVFAIEVQRSQKRRRGAVKIPEIMMDDLEAPDELPGFSAQSDHGVGPLVVAGTQAAVIVGAGAAGGNEEQVAFGINRHDGPRALPAPLREEGDLPWAAVSGEVVAAAQVRKAETNKTKMKEYADLARWLILEPQEGNGIVRGFVPSPPQV